MKISVILAHPKKDSFNHAITEVIIKTLGHSRHEVFFHDLYAEKFNPVLPDEEILEDGVIVTSTPEKRKSWLEDVSETVKKYFA